jgi:DNA-directed RNA polymerase specialized sigma24 family protein
LAAVEQRKAADVAEELGIPVSEIYVAKSRVLKMLREAVKLMGETE